jgi:hypothetical protein
MAVRPAMAMAIASCRRNARCLAIVRVWIRNAKSVRVMAEHAASTSRRLARPWPVKPRETARSINVMARARSSRSPTMLTCPRMTATSAPTTHAVPAFLCIRPRLSILHALRVAGPSAMPRDSASSAMRRSNAVPIRHAKPVRVTQAHAASTTCRMVRSLPIRRLAIANPVNATARATSRRTL